MKEKIVQALLKHAEGHIQKHIANVNILLEKQVGVAEHPDTLGKRLCLIMDHCIRAGARHKLAIRHIGSIGKYFCCHRQACLFALAHQLAQNRGQQD